MGGNQRIKNVAAQSSPQLPVARSRFVCSPSLPAYPRSPTPTSFPSKPPPKPAIPALHDPHTPSPSHRGRRRLGAVGAAVRRRRNPAMESSPAPYVDKSHFYAMIEYSINGKRAHRRRRPPKPSPHCSSPCLSLTASLSSFSIPPANPGSLESDLVQAIQDGDVDNLKGEYVRPARLVYLRAAATTSVQRGCCFATAARRCACLPACEALVACSLAGVHDLARTIIMIVSLSHTFLRGVFCCISRLFLLVSFTPMVLLTLQ
jgi:hypothetical protein